MGQDKAMDPPIRAPGKGEKIPSHDGKESELEEKGASNNINPDDVDTSMGESEMPRE